MPLKRTAAGQIMRSASNQLKRCGDCAPWWTGSPASLPPVIEFAFSVASDRPPDCCVSDASSSKKLYLNSPIGDIDGGPWLLPMVSPGVWRRTASFSCGGQLKTLRQEVGIGFLDPTQASVGVIVDICCQEDGFGLAACAGGATGTAGKLFTLIGFGPPINDVQPTNPWNLCENPIITAAGLRAVQHIFAGGDYAVCPDDYIISYSIRVP